MQMRRNVLSFEICIFAYLKLAYFKDYYDIDNS